MSELHYVADLYWPVRRETREVRVGEVGIGGANHAARRLADAEIDREENNDIEPELRMTVDVVG